MEQYDGKMRGIEDWEHVYFRDDCNTPFRVIMNYCSDNKMSVVIDYEMKYAVEWYGEPTEISVKNEAQRRLMQLLENYGNREINDAIWDLIKEACKEVRKKINADWGMRTPLTVKRHHDKGWKPLNYAPIKDSIFVAFDDINGFECKVKFIYHDDNILSVENTNSVNIMYAKPANTPQEELQKFFDKYEDLEINDAIWGLIKRTAAEVRLMERLNDTAEMERINSANIVDQRDYEESLKANYPPDFVDTITTYDEMAEESFGKKAVVKSTGNLFVKYIDTDDKIVVLGLNSILRKITREDVKDMEAWLAELEADIRSGKALYTSTNEKSNKFIDNLMKRNPDFKKEELGRIQFRQGEWINIVVHMEKDKVQGAKDDPGKDIAVKFKDLDGGYWHIILSVYPKDKLFYGNIIDSPENVNSWEGTWGDRLDEGNFTEAQNELIHFIDKYQEQDDLNDWIMDKVIELAEAVNNEGKTL